MGWTITNIRRDLSTLRKRYRESSDLKEKEIILKQIRSLMRHACDIEFSRHSKPVKISEIQDVNDIMSNEKNSEMELTEAMLYVAEYELFYPYLRRLVKVLKDIENIDSFVFEEDSYRLSNKEILELTHDFFKFTTDEIYRYYSKINSKQIRFNTDMVAGEGYTYFVPGLNKAYIDVGVCGDKRRTLNTLTHESGHVIGTFINNKRLDNTDFFFEIESLFFQYISEEYFANVLEDNTFIHFGAQRMLEYYRDVSRLLRFKEAAKKTFDGMIRGENPYTLFEEYSDGEDFSNLDVDSVVRYTISSLVAEELKEVYDQDKRAAFDLLKQIVRSNKKRTELQRITDVVSPGESLIRVKKKTLKRIIPDTVNIKMKNTD